MMRWTVLTAVFAVSFCISVAGEQARSGNPADADTAGHGPAPYDPFGPEHSPDHTGQGSGGVLTPSPYDNMVQTYFTRVNADYYGIQFMLDSPWQVSVGGVWSAYVTHGFGVLLKVRTSGIRREKFNPLRNENVPFYFLASEGSAEYAPADRDVRSFRLRVHLNTEPKGLSMAGIGVLVSEGNLLLASDRPMDRRLEAELTWWQVAGGYVMPLSPRPGGINLGLAGAVDLLGLKYQAYYSGTGEFAGAKIGSIGWVFAFGWNAGTVANLAAYAGTEWSFAAGGLILPTRKIVVADVSRTTLYLGLQATGRWFNLTGGIQKEREHLDFQQTVNTDKGIRYYLGANIYLRR